MMRVKKHQSIKQSINVFAARQYNDNTILEPVDKCTHYNLPALEECRVNGDAICHMCFTADSDKDWMDRIIF